MEKPDPLFLRCPCLEKESMGSDISLLNDEIASYIGWFLSVADDLPQDLLEDIHRCQEYHMRLLAAVSEDDIIQESDLEWIMDKFARIKIQCQAPKGYVYPNGDESAAIMHIVRAKTREMIRIAYFMENKEKRKISNLIEFANVLSNYYFYIAIRINEMKGRENMIFKGFDELKK